MTQTAQSQADITPDGVIDWLEAGNKRYVAAQPTERDVIADRTQVASGQYPLAAIVSCVDSRVIPEALFDVGLGDVFVARSAGNVVGSDMVGGLEFTTKLAGAKAIVVLGHTACGAVKGAAAGAEFGNLTALLNKIRPAVKSVADVGGDHSDQEVTDMVRQNVRNQMAVLRDTSEVLTALEESGDLVIKGAIYDLGSGAVTWLDG